ncbi:MAG: TfoX/Sxy family protein [Chloroflexota bacterium]
MNNTNELENALNLGPASAAWLREIGVVTLTDLREMGAVTAYCLVKAQRERASLNLLYALHGAMTGQKWNDLSAETKAQLQEEVAGFRFGG